MSTFAQPIGAQMTDGIAWSAPSWGNYCQFLLENPDIRACTPWSDEAIRSDVNGWLAAGLLGRTSKILDIGAAFGLYAIEFARQGHEVVAVECVESFVKEGMRLAGQASVRISWVPECFPCEVGRDFSLVCVTRCFRLWEQGYAHIVEEIRSRLTPGGLLVTDGPSPGKEFTERRCGAWHLRPDGTIVNAAEGKGHRVGVGAEAIIEEKRRVLPGVLTEAGFRILDRSPWVIAQWTG